jgi:hypothetical protein
VNSHGKKPRSRWFRVLGAVLLALVLAAILIPHNLVSHIAHDEASSATSLRSVKKLEQRYAAAHPSGFTCDFSVLKPELSEEEQIHGGFLFSEGYKFSLTGCEADANGVAVRFKAFAIPVKLGETGVRTFCMDQTGELQYSLNGSPQNCQPM